MFSKHPEAVPANAVKDPAPEARTPEPSQRPIKHAASKWRRSSINQDWLVHNTVDVIPLQFVGSFERWC